MLTIVNVWLKKCVGAGKDTTIINGSGSYATISMLDSDLPPVFVPVFKLELNPIPNCFVSTEVVES
jgi:hypothetical protein